MVERPRVMQVGEEALRVILLSTDYLPNIGGLAAHVAGLAGGLARTGHAVTVVVPRRVRGKWLPRKERERSQGFDVLRIGVPVRAWFCKPYARYVAAEMRALLDSGYQIMHWHTFDNEIVERLDGVPRVFTNHTSYFLEFVADPARIERARAIVTPADIVIAPSRERAEAAVKAGCPPDRARVIPSGVDTDRFTPSVDRSVVRSRYGIADEECLMLCPRRLIKVSGVMYWIRAIPLLIAATRARLRFMFVGDWQHNDEHSCREEALAAMKELGLDDRLIFTGAVPNAEMHFHFAASDVVVLPSLVEATSVAGLEAMASGRPILATNVGGLPDIIANGDNGLLVPPANSEALAEGAKKLAEWPELRARMGRVGRERAEREFDWRKIADRTVAVYREAIELRASAGQHATVALK